MNILNRFFLSGLCLELKQENDQLELNLHFSLALNQHSKSACLTSSQY